MSDHDDGSVLATQLLLLDFQSLWDESEQDMSEDGFNLLVRELNDVGAFAVSVEGGEGDIEVDVNIGPMLSAAGSLLHLVISTLAMQTQRDRLEVINMIRERVRAAHE